MSKSSTKHASSSLWQRALNRPRLMLFMAAMSVVVFGIGLRGVSKEPSVDAFVPDNHPAALARDAARDVFGLEDPVVIGLQVASDQSIFSVDALNALRRADSAVRDIDGVKYADVVSLASENAIGSDDGDLIVESILPDAIASESDVAIAAARYQSMPMLTGLLVSADARMATIIAPVEDPDHAGATIAAIKTAVIAATGDVFTVHVAGVAAMNARLSGMVDTDTRIFVPAAIVTVLLILFVALRTGKALLGPLFVIAGSAAIAIGCMGWMGARYYLITTALPVVIMAIAVADTLHISTFYMQARRTLDARAAVLEALQHTWLPVTLTSITTIAAFIGLSFGAAMQPISEFGQFAAVGVAAAWLLSLTALPAILILGNVKPRSASAAHSSVLTRALAQISSFAVARPTAALWVVMAVIGIFGFYAGHAAFDYERQRYFVDDDAVRRADIAINEALGGINFLDVVVQAPAGEDLLTPNALAQIAQLRNDMQRLPPVAKVSGIDQYLSLMHSVLTGAAAGALPESVRAPGQYLFLYEASGAPEDFKQEISYDYDKALLRAQLSTDRYSATSNTVAALESMVVSWSNDSGLRAEVSGRVAVNNGWMDQLANNHFIGLGLASALVLFTALIVFRSFVFAALAMMPLVVGVLAVYATMGLLGVDIAPATSMTTAIATGLGVDFGIHLISHLRRRLAAGDDIATAMQGDYQVVARACFYSAVALGVALAVICISSAPPLRWFGMLVSVGAIGSLFGALVIVPGLLATASRVASWRLHQHA